MIEVGKSLTREIVVDDARAISFMGPELRVYGTPSVLADIEFVCRDLLRSLLPEGQDSVGSQVVLDHIGAAPLGAKANISAAIASVDNRKVVFSATVTFNGREIARANHTRTIVVVADLKARIAKLKP
ncbi:MAG: thioesterase family protein [Xanthobacteraceae bacterium]